MNLDDIYYDKYQKYKSKYLKLKQKGGAGCITPGGAALGVCLADDESILDKSRDTIFDKLSTDTTMHEIHFYKSRTFIDNQGKKHSTKKIIAEVSYYYNKPGVNILGMDLGGTLERRSHNYLNLSNAFIEVSTGTLFGGEKTKIPVKRVISAKETDNVTTGLYVVPEGEKYTIKKEPKSIIDLNGESTEGLQQWLEPIGGQLPSYYDPNSKYQVSNRLQPPFNIQSISDKILPSNQNYPGTWTWGPPSTNPM